MKKRNLFASVITVLLSVVLSLSSAFAVSAATATSTTTAATSTSLTATTTTTTTTDSTHPGFRVEGRFLYDYTGEKVILYGINKMCIWTDIDGEPSFSEIAKTGANCVRIVWNTTGTAAQLDTVITNCRKEHMIPIIELHDATGDWSKLSTLVDYWVRSDIVAVIQKHQQYLLVNIGNEVGNSVTESDFESGYETAVTRMRTAGIHVPLIIDSSAYASNINMVQSCGPTLIAADPDSNLMFSVHMYWPSEYGYTAQNVIDELAESANMNLPLVIGEFGNAVDTTEQGKIPYKTIIENCYKNQIGYLPWSWGPGNNPQTFLDMTTDSTYATLHDWGLEVAVTDTYSIQNIAQRPVSMLSSLPPSLPEEPMPAGNLALNKTATSSSEASSSYTASNITDGDYDTRWASTSTDPSWVYVDLGSTKSITSMIIRWEAAYATQYKIQVSDDATTWTDIYTQYSGTGGTENISLTGSGRYVRIYGMQRYNSSWGYSIYDIGVYGPDSASSASVSPTVAVFDKYAVNQADMPITLTSNGNTLNAVKSGDTVLTAGTDYTVSDNILTIKKEYLAAQSVGTIRLTFDYSDGADPFIFIAVGDTSPSAYIRPGRVDFNKNTSAQADVSTTMTLSDNTLVGIENGSTYLVLGQDYTIDGNVVTIKKEYLAEQSVGVTRLTFDFSSGDDQVLKVNVTDTTASSTITPTSASFDLYTANQADITVGVTLNGNTLSGIYNGTAALVKDTDYTVASDSTVTILKSYLAKQSVGTTSLTFDFSAGTDPVLTLTVSDGTPVNSSNISPTTSKFDKSNQADIAVSVTANGNTLNGIYNGTTALVKDTDYTIASDGTVTILKSYFASQATGTVGLTFDFNAGTDPVLKVTVTDSSVVVSGSLTIQEYNASTSTSSNSITPRFKLVNTGSTAIDLSTVKIRYYFTKNGSQAQTNWCDWSTVGSTNVTSSFVTMSTAVTGADTYLEIGFTSGAGTLAAGASIEVQTRFAKSDWTNYTQSDDYSFNSSNNNYVDWAKVTAFIDGALVWGSEPV